MSEFMNFLKGIKHGSKDFGETISIIINSVMLFVVYFLGIGLTSFFAKLLGKSFLDLKTDKETESYWKELNLTKQPTEAYYRQF